MERCWGRCDWKDATGAVGMTGTWRKRKRLECNSSKAGNFTPSANFIRTLVTNIRTVKISMVLAP
eukprot:12923386-Prorocentrum_lima.AAC.1